MSEFRKVYEGKKLEMNVDDTKLMNCSISIEYDPLRIIIIRDKLEKTRKFNYSKSTICVNSEMKVEMSHRSW